MGQNMEQYYTSERNVQIVIALLKEHGIKRIVASPGSTNVTFVGSVQQDPFFEIYSCVDERSAAYMACGIALKTGEPCVLSCTGATASRNYFSALTEAYYRKLPILAITSTQPVSKIGNMHPQVIDRFSQPHDCLKMSVHVQEIKDKDDEWDSIRKVNEAILELDHHGMGPVHINLTTSYSKDFSVKTLPVVRVIKRVTSIKGNFPEIESPKVAIYVGSHKPWNKRLTDLVDSFCEIYNAVVFTDTTANYQGKYRMNYTLVAAQKRMEKGNSNPELLIHIGEVSDEASKVGVPNRVWRVSEDGHVADRYQKLEYIFEMSEEYFFEKVTQGKYGKNNTYYDSCIKDIEYVNSLIPELPLSHIWVASKLHGVIPKGSILHLGILSPLRSWSYFDIDSSIDVQCNQGGFGIDGNMSTLIGTSLVNPNTICYAVVGDLSFFYDINILGNRHIGNNVRILLINNSLGAEFHLFKQLNSIYVNGIDKYLSAGGHNGQKSPNLVKNIAENLGFDYFSASTKEEFEERYLKFVSPTIGQKPMVFEVFTDVKNEDLALYKMWNIVKDGRREFKDAIKKYMPEKTISVIKKIINN